MAPRIALFLALLAPVSLGAFAGCGHDGGGPGYHALGYACRDDLDCEPTLACVEEHGGACWPLCNSDFDCGPGYTCKNVSRHGHPDKSRVCLLR